LYAGASRGESAPRGSRPARGGRTPPTPPTVLPTTHPTVLPEVAAPPPPLTSAAPPLAPWRSAPPLLWFARGALSGGGRPQVSLVAILDADKEVRPAALSAGSASAAAPAPAPPWRRRALLSGPHAPAPPRLAVLHRASLLLPLPVSLLYTHGADRPRAFCARTSRSSRPSGAPRATLRDRRLPAPPPPSRERDLAHKARPQSAVPSPLASSPAPPPPPKRAPRAFGRLSAASGAGDSVLRASDGVDAPRHRRDRPPPRHPGARHPPYSPPHARREAGENLF